jgi:hypothetical protein
MWTERTLLEPNLQGYHCKGSISSTWLLSSMTPCGLIDGCQDFRGTSLPNYMMSQETIILVSLLLEPQTSHLQCIWWWSLPFSETWHLGSLVDTFHPLKGHIFFHCSLYSCWFTEVYGSGTPFSVSVSLSWSAYFSTLRMEAVCSSEA